MKKKYYLWYKYYPYIITAVFLTLSIILITRHELWHDEIAAWNIGLESTSIQDFAANMRGTGHSYPWYAILYFISHFITRNLESMKVIHLAISTASVFLFLKYAPFNRTVKALFVFGYFPFYEYSIISRNYAIGILPIIIFCILYKNKYKNIIFIAITLFFMSQASIYAFIIFIVFVFYIIVDFIIDRKIFIKSINKIHLAVAAAIVILGIIFIYWQFGSQATQDNAFGPTIFTMFDNTIDQYRQSANLISKGIISVFVPIPEATLNFWYTSSAVSPGYTNLIITYLSNFRFLYTFILSIILLIIPVFVIKRRTIILYILGSISILLFAFFIYGGSIRHFGHLFILLIACIWISNLYSNKYRYLVNYNRNQSKTILNIFLTVFLSLSVIGSSIAAYFDYRYPFSSGKQVAEYIEGNYDKENVIIVGYRDIDACTVSTYLDKDIYLPQYRNFGRFVFQNDVRIHSLESDEIFSQAFSFINQTDKVLVVIHCNAIKDAKVPQRYLFKKVDVEFDDSIVGYENFCLYESCEFEKKLLIINSLANKPIFDYNSYNNAEFQDSKLSGDGKEIIFEKSEGELKICKIPIVIKANKDYLISLEIKKTKDLDNIVYFDLIGSNYDNPDQEFIYRGINKDYIPIVRIINSGEIPAENDIYFRIFTDTIEEVVIRNLEVYEIN